MLLNVVVFFFQNSKRKEKEREQLRLRRCLRVPDAICIPFFTWQASFLSLSLTMMQDAAPRTGT